MLYGILASHRGEYLQGHHEGARLSVGMFEGGDHRIVGGVFPVAESPVPCRNTSAVGSAQVAESYRQAGASGCAAAESRQRARDHHHGFRLAVQAACRIGNGKYNVIGACRGIDVYRVSHERGAPVAKLPVPYLGGIYIHRGAGGKLRGIVVATGYRCEVDNRGCAYHHRLCGRIGTSAGNGNDQGYRKVAG